jgi:hypothetical protein
LAAGLSPGLKPMVHGLESVEHPPATIGIYRQ